jgi:glutamate synthase domain-containing protein 3
MTKGLVVVLGKVGRNFAAGMSGGIAYVLDEKRDFAEKRCNTKEVDLEAVSEEDAAMLQTLISRHAELTGSPRAKWILENWEQMIGSFVKVFPKEYKRVLVGQASRPVPDKPGGLSYQEVAARG